LHDAFSLFNDMNGAKLAAPWPDGSANYARKLLDVVPDLPELLPPSIGSGIQPDGSISVTVASMGDDLDRLPSGGRQRR